MRYSLMLLVCLLVSPCPATSYNGQESLAMHVVASCEYLECPDLCPSDMSCLNVDCDLTLLELEASGGYGYVAFLCYNTEDVLMVEFFVAGWPSENGAPDFDGPYYCAGGDALVVGEPFEQRGGDGGAVVFGCQEPCAGLYCFCYIAFGPEVLDWLPISLEYAPSSFSYPADPHNFVQDCTSFEEGLLSHEHGAVIGGACDPIPNCLPGPSPAGSDTWGTIKNLYR